MHIQASRNSQTRSPRGRGNGPDDVPPEFPQRESNPGGPDDVYDPDHTPRSDSGGCGPHYYDTDTRDGGSVSFLG